MPNPNKPVASLIADAERYLAGDNPLDAIAWADAVIPILINTTFGHDVATALRAWMQTPEPLLGDELIRRGLEKLRMVA